LQSRPEDAYISGEGTDDNVMHCMLSDFESYRLEMRNVHSLGRKTLTSPGKVQMEMLVNETFLQSEQKDAYISGEGADDDVSHCILFSFESYG